MTQTKLLARTRSRPVRGAAARPRPVEAMAGQPAEPVPELHPWPGQKPGKARRAMDIAVSLGVLTLAGLPLLILMLAVRLTSRGPALFRQVRVGQGERVFTLLKLRSMRVDPGGPDITASHDPRVTRLGALLRRTSLDELPQLVNILRGDMTLVGPRPETPALAVVYPATCRWIFAYRPGLTGPAQVRMRDSDVLGTSAPTESNYVSVVVPARTRIEAAYLATPTVPATIGVLADTVRHVLGMAARRRD